LSIFVFLCGFAGYAEPPARPEQLSQKTRVMNTDRPITNPASPRRQNRGSLSGQSRRHVQRGSGGVYFADITLADMLHKIWLGLQKLSVAFRYQFHRLTAGVLSDIRLPWYKIALAAVALLIVTKKDIQFSINMKAPLSGFPSEEAAGSQMSLAQPIALKMQESNLPINQLDGQKAQAYIKRFSKVAAAEMEKFGIPASVKMAQALLESGAGEYSQARQANNHFGLSLAGQIYNSAWENWRAHSLLLQNEYPGLFNAGASYKKWAGALEKSGYTNDKQYGDKLVELIEKFQLYKLDQF